MRNKAKRPPVIGSRFVFFCLQALRNQLPATFIRFTSREPTVLAP